MKRYIKHKDFDNVIVLTPPKKKEVNMLDDIAIMHLLRLGACKEREKLTDAMDCAGINEIWGDCIDKVGSHYHIYEIRVKLKEIKL
jgi:hypothetical protein